MNLSSGESEAMHVYTLDMRILPLAPIIFFPELRWFGDKAGTSFSISSSEVDCFLRMKLFDLSSERGRVRVSKHGWRDDEKKQTDSHWFFNMRSQPATSDCSSCFSLMSSRKIKLLGGKTSFFYFFIGKKLSFLQDTGRGRGRWCEKIFATLDGCLQMPTWRGYSTKISEASLSQEELYGNYVPLWFFLTHIRWHLKIRNSCAMKFLLSR